MGLPIDIETVEDWTDQHFDVIEPPELKDALGDYFAPFSNFYLTLWGTWNMSLHPDVDLVFKAGAQLYALNTKAIVTTYGINRYTEQKIEIGPAEPRGESSAFAFGFNYQFAPKTSFELSVNLFSILDSEQKLSLSWLFRRK